MTHEYTPASDTTLAFFRKDVERDDRSQLESIMISRVVMGEILARLDRAEYERDQIISRCSLTVRNGANYV